MARYPECVFCRSTKFAPAEEDIFARWIAREWPKGRFQIEAGFVNSEPDKTWGSRAGPGKHSGLGFTTRRPCTRCNSGWMSRLESDTKPILKPLIWGKPTTLTPSHQLAIGRWLMKTTMAWEFFHNRKYPRFFTPSERFIFHQRPHAVPSGVMMSIAHYVGGDDARFIEGPGISLELAIDGTSIRGHGYVTTFTIGQLALQVFAHRWPKHVTAQRVKFTVPGSWRTCTCDIWPVKLANVSWPPAIALDNHALELFSDRFYKLLR